jgi:hypothetical protein
MIKNLIWISALLILVIVCFNCHKRVETDSYAEVLADFQDPPSEFRSAPLWVWNDLVTREQIEIQLADFKAHGIGGVFIHPRPGLITPYLSEEWLSLCRHAVDVGKKLGMKVWIYDENSYPSGFAGGHVPAEMPDSIGLALRMTKAAALPAEFAEKPLLILHKTDSGFEDITERALQAGTGSALGTGEYYLFDIQKASVSPWFGGYAYVDIMRKDVTEKFLDITLNAYKRVIGDEFGVTVPGSFQDEAHIHPAGGPDAVNFTPRLFEQFQAKWGYDLRVFLRKSANGRQSVIIITLLSSTSSSRTGPGPIMIIAPLITLSLRVITGNTNGPSRGSAPTTSLCSLTRICPGSTA